MASTSSTAVLEIDGLADHGDTQVPPGMLDLAVNVVSSTPDWLREEFGRLDLTRYPAPGAARRAVADRHGLAPEQVLLTNGAAEAFWAVAHGLRARLAACVHPSFTAPEAALRSAGVPVHRVIRRAEDDFALDVSEVPDEADLVVLGRPDNPTGRLEPVDVIASLARPGRTVVVDEAFADFLPGGDSLVSEDLPGVVCVRSLTKLWGLAGVRIGYVLGDEAVLARLRSALQPWPVNSFALHAAERLSDREEERRARADKVAARRASLVAELADVPDGALRVWASPANFLLLRHARPGLRDSLREQGIATRRCRTFPGLDDRYLRVAVPVEAASGESFVTALREIVGPG